MVCAAPLMTVDRQIGLNIVHPDGKPARTVFRRIRYDANTDSSVVFCAFACSSLLPLHGFRLTVAGQVNPRRAEVSGVRPRGGVSLNALNGDSAPAPGASAVPGAPDRE